MLAPARQIIKVHMQGFFTQRVQTWNGLRAQLMTLKHGQLAEIMGGLNFPKRGRPQKDDDRVEAITHYMEAKCQPGRAPTAGAAGPSGSAGSR
mmetsp:Transcript_108495/g.339400  ORF Transcript_108495/g.339400 Transcript_108495/m.339400 type:complete len:93 (-) Transcript_108495:117-395(-)